MGTLPIGTLFGEVSAIYGCKRSSSVQSIVYGSCARIHAANFNEVLDEFPEMRTHVIENQIQKYDDELKLFLVKALRQIDYLQEVDEEILIHLAFMMNSKKHKAGDYLYTKNKDAVDKEYFNLDSI